MRVLPNGTFLIKKGAVVRRNEAATLSASAKRLRAGLLEKGLVVDNGQDLILNQDYSVEAVSTAAAVVSGTTINGRNAWKLPDGRTYAQVEEASASSVTSLPALAEAAADTDDETDI